MVRISERHLHACSRRFERTLRYNVQRRPGFPGLTVICDLLRTPLVPVEPPLLGSVTRIESCLKLKGRSSSARLPYAGVQASHSSSKISRWNPLAHTRSESRFSTQARCYLHIDSCLQLTLSILLQGVCHTDEYTRSGADPEVCTLVQLSPVLLPKWLTCQLKGGIPGYSWS